ncbi:MAG: SDR family NAD(P)-dependent oxidoreductase [Syntrophomonadaceae bacterium]|jgi:3-oxoacyl-[acyl-carrier protein] reductase
MKQFENKYAVITGAGSGISRETASVLAERGAQGIILADLNLENANNAAREISTTTGCNCIPFKIDVSNPSEIESLFAFVGEKFGRVDILVNGAGIAPYLTIEEVDVDAWDKCININLRGTYLCAREAFFYMKAQKYGKIINVSSIAARIGGIASGINYVASKGGVVSLTYSLAKIGAKYNINANGVAPGVIATPLTASHNYSPDTIIGQPRDVATVIAFLASEDAKHINGCTLEVNGGAYMH